ncbi:unnamed protein product [Ectocarpus sp. 4 AP-2014]
MLALSVIGALLRTAIGPNEEPSDDERPLITVSPVRAQVLCSACLGENDGRFSFCQWCGVGRVRLDTQQRNPPLIVDEQAIMTRFSEFKKMWEKKRHKYVEPQLAHNLEKILVSREERLVAFEEACPEDVVQFLCWLDTCGTRRRTVVHARHCQAIGTSDLERCSTAKGECNRRYAHESMRTNHVSKLAIVLEEKKLGVTGDWNNVLKARNPVRSDPLHSTWRSRRNSKREQGSWLSKRLHC